MNVLILEDDPLRRAEAGRALEGEGLRVVTLGEIEEAKGFVRRGGVDLLFLAERVGGRLAHDVALLAEWRNPRLAVVLLTDRHGEEAEEIFALIPSIRAVLGRRATPATLARVARIALGARNAEPAAMRLARRWAQAEAAAQDGQGEAAPPQPEESDGSPPDAPRAGDQVTRIEPPLAPAAPRRPGSGLPSFLTRRPGSGLPPTSRPSRPTEGSARLLDLPALPISTDASVQRLRLA